MIYKNKNAPIKKVIAKTNAQTWTRGTVYSVHGNQINLQLGKSPTLIKHVEVVGDISQCAPGVEVPIVWKNRRPIAMPGSVALVPPDPSTGAAVSPYQNRYDILWEHGISNAPLNPTMASSQIMGVGWTFSGIGLYNSFAVTLEAGTYQIDLLGQTSNGGGIFQVWIDGVLISDGNDTYTASSVYNVIMSFGPFSLARGPHTFMFIVTDANPSSNYHVLNGTLLSIYPVT